MKLSKICLIVALAGIPIIIGSAYFDSIIFRQASFFGYIPVCTWEYFLAYGGMIFGYLIK